MCPVPQHNEWFIDVPSLQLHQQTSIQLAPPQSRNHPSVPTFIPYSSNPAGRSPSPAGSPTPFPGLSHAQSPHIPHAQSPIFLMLNPPVFLTLNLAIALVVVLAAATWSPQPPSHTSSHTFGNSPFFGDFDCEAEFSGLVHQHKNLVILDPPNPNDGNPDVEDDDLVAKEGDTAQIKSQGGPFTDEQVAEIRGIVESMNRELERKVKEWDRPLESASYEKDPEPDRPHHEYVEKVIQPAYRELIAEHGGEDSNAWKKKSKELVDQHNASKAAQAFDIALSLAAIEEGLGALMTVKSNSDSASV
ncbi:hypothetical protein BS47DRAFT_1388076 [Hydnum rufescens UP504]|uniref:Uncharacterized protein n=1 Tax=Hydnum rufescens UP504 TaxID=1448309 RepID=A0A9P6DZH1_9AGAM|nr:hypothetical protein BS47DRAFT_1388076 [Hydnum rufescens UP504]